jgi:glycosyltransferase involved in cell wall biosynthesis
MASNKPLTSIIIPVFNESEYILTTLKKCCDLPIHKEIIVVDNNSTDNSYELVRSFIDGTGRGGRIRLERARKQGKASAMKVGIATARGDYIVFQDADMEYEPGFIVDIVEALEHNDIIHGCRVCRPYDLGFLPYLANKLVLHMMTKRYRVKLSDVFTGQRGYKRGVILGLNIISEGFEIETELTIRAILSGLCIKEIDIPYKPRTRREGKKIGFMDFLAIAYMYEKICRLVSRENKRNRVLAGAH